MTFFGAIIRQKIFTFLFMHKKRSERSNYKFFQSIESVLRHVLNEAWKNWKTKIVNLKMVFNDWSFDVTNVWGIYKKIFHLKDFNSFDTFGSKYGRLSTSNMARSDCDAPCFEQLKATHLRASQKQQALLDVLLQLLKTWPLTIGPWL